MEEVEVLNLSSNRSCQTDMGLEEQEQLPNEGFFSFLRLRRHESVFL
jgi:hypothetical protein